MEREISNPNYEELIIKSFLEFLKEKSNLQPSDIFNLLNKESIIQIPTSIFNKKLGPLESIVKFLKEDKYLDYNKISLLLKRNPGPIGITYRNSKKKFDSRLSLDSKYFIPITIFSNQKLTILENIVFYLKDHYSLNFHKVAVLLSRDDRTIWTVYQKSLKKLNPKKDGKKRD